VPGVAGPPLDVMLVVEGAARKIAGTTEVTVVPTTRSGDDAIVDDVAAEVGTRRCVVVTADRDLRTRVRALGAEVVGPRTIYAASHLTRD
jgi:rRNA-processing protein FCF1